MKLTVKQLRTIIKEEVESAMSQAAAPKKPAAEAPPVEESGDWKKSDPEWVALKKRLGAAEYYRRYVRPEKNAAGRTWMRSLAAPEYDAIWAQWPAVRDSYSIMVGEFALNGEDSEEYLAAAKENDEAVKKMQAAYDEWKYAF